MPVRMACPGCSAPLDIVERLQGKQVRCPECHQVFTFAGPSAAVSLTPSASVPPRRTWDTREEPRQSERSSGTLLVGLLVGAVALALVLCGGGLVGGVLLFRSEAAYYEDEHYYNEPVMPEALPDLPPEPMEVEIQPR